MCVPDGEAVKLYLKELCGGIGHCVTKGTPSIYGVSIWWMPCQWILELSLIIELTTLTWTVSPSHTYSENAIIFFLIASRSGNRCFDSSNETNALL